jgi:hypothetical protein
LRQIVERSLKSGVVAVQPDSKPAGPNGNRYNASHAGERPTVFTREGDGGVEHQQDCHSDGPPPWRDKVALRLTMADATKVLTLRL